MRLASGTILTLLLVQPMASSAKPSAAQPPAKDLAVLKQGADALIKQAASSPGQPDNPSAGQGAEHAALRAIQVVCSKDTPAAQHAAICHPNSPF